MVVEVVTVVSVVVSVVEVVSVVVKNCGGAMILIAVEHTGSVQTIDVKGLVNKLAGAAASPEYVSFSRS